MGVKSCNPTHTREKTRPQPPRFLSTYSNGGLGLLSFFHRLMDFDDCLPTLDQRHCIPESLQEKQLEQGVRHVARSDPDDLRWRTTSLSEAHEVLILRHDNCPGVPCLLEDIWVFNITKAEIANMETFNSEGLPDPLRQSRGELSIQPDDHAARIGWLTRWLAKRRQA